MLFRSITGKNITFFHQIEQYITPNPSTPPTLAGWTPDALLPVDGPFDIADTDTKSLWVTVYTPEDTPAGTYTGQITVKPANAPAWQVNLTLAVRDFAIPRVGQFRTQCHFSVDTVKKWYGQDFNDKVRQDYYRLLLDYRISPTSQYQRMISPDLNDLDWIMRDGGTVIVIGGYHTKPLEPENIALW